jgi:hypothetical protein
MKRKYEILAAIILLCIVSGFICYEYSKPECIQTPQIKILYYSIPNDHEEFDMDDISDTIRDRRI